jgi:hypothetical protein
MPERLLSRLFHRLLCLFDFDVKYSPPAKGGKQHMEPEAAWELEETTSSSSFLTSYLTTTLALLQATSKW